MAHRQQTIRTGFTLVELLTACLITALVATASAALISAVSSASIQTKQSRQVKNAGNYALNRITSTIREARSVGNVSSTAMTLWLNDTNSDDATNLYETAVIRYDSSTQRILFEYMENKTATPTTTVTTAQLTNTSTLQSLITGSDKQSVVWGDGVTDFTLTGYPNNTDTRIVQMRFTMGTGSDATAFQATASPKGGGDYLFTTTTKESPKWTARQTRVKKSRYTGVSTAP